MFTLETINLASGPTVAIARNGSHVPIAAAGARLGLTIPDVSLFALIDTWNESWKTIREIADKTHDKQEFTVQNARVAPQFGSARKVMCGGANYYKHLLEMDVKHEKDASKAPFFFMKPNTALVGPGKTIPMASTIKMLDWEVELALVIGKGGRDIPVARALDHVAGYTVAIDVTARDRLFQPDSIFKFDFLAGKGQDGFCPTAAGMLPAAFLTDPQNTRLRLLVNGVSKQDASTDDMIYSVAELISWASKIATLEPGDVMLTGSPEGVGFPKREFLKVGDVMRAEVDPLLTFDVEVCAKPDASS